MCAENQRTDRANETDISSLRKKRSRRSLWEIDHMLHCSIIGTCLSLRNLNAIARKSNMRFNKIATEYEIHSTFIRLSKDRNDVSKLVNKALEKRHRGSVSRFGRAETTSDLREIWNEAFRAGDVAGAYWAVMSHPLLNEEIAAAAFGDVHMLSHALGASRRLDTRRLHAAQTARETLEGKLSWTKSVFRERLKNRDVLIEELHKRLSGLERTERRLALADNNLLKLKRSIGVVDLEARIKDLEGALKSEKEYSGRIAAGFVENQAMLDREMARADRALDRARLLTGENVALERELTITLECTCNEGTCEDVIEDNGKSLCGRKIMYVGGRSNLVRHYRELVERRGGELVHHDGGVERSMALLHNALKNVDTVVCPIDCVSHGACQSVKRTCKHMSKQFIPLRSAGLSSFARGIQGIA